MLGEGASRAQINVGKDGKALPGWYTHFGDAKFAKSALPTVTAHIEAAVPKGPITVVALGAGNAFYERTLAGELLSRGFAPTLLVSDLQKTSLAEIPDESFPVVPIHGDSTQLRLEHSGNPTVVASRALEHYLSGSEFTALLHTAHQLTGADGLYMPQISSGNPLALEAFSAALTGTVGKDERFFTIDEYRAKVAQVIDPAGQPLLQEVAIGYAAPQERGARELARRYVPEFVDTQADSFANGHRAQYRREAQLVEVERARLGAEVAQGRERVAAIAELDGIIGSTKAYDVYRRGYLDNVVPVWETAGFTEGRGLQPREGGEDIGIIVEYPIFVWK